MAAAYRARRKEKRERVAVGNVRAIERERKSKKYQRRIGAQIPVQPSFKLARLRSGKIFKRKRESEKCGFVIAGIGKRNPRQKKSKKRKREIYHLTSIFSVFAYVRGGSARRRFKRPRKREREKKHR